MLDRDSSDLRRQVAAMTKELAAIRCAVERLYGLLTEKPARGGPRRATVAPAQLGELHKSRCLKARIARAARRHSLTVEEWLARFGPVDRLPAGVPRDSPAHDVDSLATPAEVEP